MHEPDQHPLRHQRGLRLDHGLEQGNVRLLGAGRRRVVAGDGVIGELLHQAGVAMRSGVLERSDAQVAGGNPDEDRTR